MAVLSRIQVLQQTYLTKGSLRERFATGVFWSVAGAVISRGLTLLSSIVLARMLGTSGFGELGMVQGTVGMLGTLGGIGLGMTATKYVAENRHHNPAKSGRIIGLSLLSATVAGGLLCVLLILFAPWLAVRTLAAPHLAPVLRIGGVLLFFSAISGVQTGSLAGFEAFQRIARIGLTAGLLSFPILVGGAFAAGLQGVLWALAAATALNCLLNHFALKELLRENGMSIDYAKSASELPVLWKFSLPAFLSGAMVTPVNWLCSAILVNQPNGYFQMGIFNAANQWRNAILFIPGSMSTIVLPLLASLQSVDDSGRYKKVLWYNTLLNTGIALLAALIISLAATPIMAGYGRDFAPGAGTLVALSVAAALSAGASVIGQAIASKGWMWWGVILNACWGGVLVVSTVMQAGDGALGLARANVIAYAAHLALVGAFTAFILPEGRLGGAP